MKGQFPHDRPPSVTLLLPQSCSVNKAARKCFTIAVHLGAVCCICAAAVVTQVPTSYQSSPSTDPATHIPLCTRFLYNLQLLIELHATEMPHVSCQLQALCITPHQDGNVM